ncbi:MAG: hypothetical protein NTAFB09_05760 [Nitrosospira sp.]
MNWVVPCRLTTMPRSEHDERPPARTRPKLRVAASDHMVMLENNPERVKSYFQDPRVKYAA